MFSCRFRSAFHLFFIPLSFKVALDTFLPFSSLVTAVDVLSRFFVTVVVELSGFFVTVVVACAAGAGWALPAGALP